MQPPEAVSCQKHPKNQTRLRCSHCQVPICPQCMISTEVGFKCPDCIKGQMSHLHQLTMRHWIISTLLSMAAGFGYGFLHPWLYTLPYFNVMGLPVLGLLLAFALGNLSGQGIKRCISYKRHPGLTPLILSGIGIGLLSGPYFSIMVSLFSLLAVMIQDGSVGNVGVSQGLIWIQLMVHLGLPYIFIRGVLSGLNSNR